MRLEAEWLGRPGVRAVIAALGAGEVWFVGGAVRNTMMGRSVADIDIATPLLPDQVTLRLKAASIRALPTGIEHGTVTALARGETIEITTFRSDIETDGRHAMVRFGEGLEEDARRRDFTINALYADPSGLVIDPLGGLEDLRARRVRFIGSAEARIREDYLRILRFFRFHALYGGSAIDPKGLTAVRALVDGIAGLARERIGAEMRKLLAAVDPGPALTAMADAGVLEPTLPGGDPALIGRVVRLEAEAGIAPDWRVRLAAIGGDDPVAALRLSRVEARFLAEVAQLLAEPLPPAVAAHAVGLVEARAAALIEAAGRGGTLPAGLEAELARGVAAAMPLGAADLIGAGLTEGPGLGRALDRAETAWRRSDFSLDRAALLAHALDNGQQN